MSLLQSVLLFLPNQPIETDLHYCLGYVSVTVGGLLLNLTSNYERLKRLCWLSLCYSHCSLASKHPYAAQGDVHDRLRLDCWLSLYYGWWSPACTCALTSLLPIVTDCGYCLGYLSVKIRALLFNRTGLLRWTLVTI